METSIIIGLILFIIISVIILKFVKKIAKAIFLISSLAILILAILGVIVFLDINNFKENFSTTPSLYLLQKDGKIVSGFGGVFAEEKSPSLLNKSALDPINSDFQTNNMDAVKNGYYKLFIINFDAFASLNTIKMDNNTELTLQQISDLLSSDTPADDYIKAYVKGNLSQTQRELIRKQMLEDSNLEDDAQFKGILFGMLFKSAVEEKGPLFIFDQYKQNKLVIYPETALFKAIKLVPSSLLGKIIQTKAG